MSDLYKEEGTGFSALRVLAALLSLHRGLHLGLVRIAKEYGYVEQSAFERADVYGKMFIPEGIWGILHIVLGLTLLFSKGYGREGAAWFLIATWLLSAGLLFWQDHLNTLYIYHFWAAALLVFYTRRHLGPKISM